MPPQYPMSTKIYFVKKDLEDFAEFDDREGRYAKSSSHRRRPINVAHESGVTAGPAQ